MRSVSKYWNIFLTWMRISNAVVTDIFHCIHSFSISHSCLLLNNSIIFTLWLICYSMIWYMIDYNFSFSLVFLSHVGTCEKLYSNLFSKHNVHLQALQAVLTEQYMWYYVVKYPSKFSFGMPPGFARNWVSKEWSVITWSMLAILCFIQWNIGPCVWI